MAALSESLWVVSVATMAESSAGQMDSLLAVLLGLTTAVLLVASLDDLKAALKASSTAGSTALQWVGPKALQSEDL
jgi:hypothetical protein